MHSLNSNFIEKYDFRLEKWIALNLNQQNDFIKNNSFEAKEYNTNSNFMNNNNHSLNY